MLKSDDAVAIVAHATVRGGCYIHSCHG